jgi:hypothetical protein
MDHQFEQPTRSPKFNPRKFTKHAFFLPVVVVGAVILLAGIFLLTRSSDNPISAVAGDNSKVSIAKPTANQTLNKKLEFPLKNSAGKEISKLSYVVENAELRDEIIVKGKRAISVEGRTFLVLNIKITNVYNKAIQVNARDYVRLTVNKNADKIAADIHNDPVEIQADSTKTTRLGFPINETDKDLTLLIGELEGTKQTIKLDLK